MQWPYGNWFIPCLCLCRSTNETIYSKLLVSDIIQPSVLCHLPIALAALVQVLVQCSSTNDLGRALHLLVVDPLVAVAIRHPYSNEHLLSLILLASYLFADGHQYAKINIPLQQQCWSRSSLPDTHNQAYTTRTQTSQELKIANNYYPPTAALKGYEFVVGRQCWAGVGHTPLATAPERPGSTYQFILQSISIHCLGK